MPNAVAAETVGNNVVGNVTYVTGDLFTTNDVFPFEGLAHGCNCKGTMGAGIANQFRLWFPEMYQEYKEVCHRKLLTPGQVFHYTDTETDLHVFNLLTQDNPGRDAKLDWVADSLREMQRMCEAAGVTVVGMPLVGTGIGGLDVDEVKDVIEQVANEPGRTTKFVVFDEYVPGMATRW